MIAQFERFEIEMTKDQAHTGSHQGQCDDDVAYLLTIPNICRQLDKIDPILLAAELAEYGAWGDEELQDHEQNKARIVWIAAGNIIEEC